MFDGLKRKLAAEGIVSVLKSLAGSNDTKTTITGIVAGAVVAIPGLDWSQVLAGDPMSIARLLSGFVIAQVGYLATKPGHDGHTTALGTVAGALYAVQGSLQSVITAVVIALVGYLTNKPVVGGVTASLSVQSMPPKAP
jgi:hypothetical protein